MQIEVSIRFLPAACGRATPPILSDYRPHLRIDAGPLLGVRIAADAPQPAWGETVTATAELVYAGLVDYSGLIDGARFAVYEGPYVVGDGVVLCRLPEESGD